MAKNVIQFLAAIDPEELNQQRSTLYNMQDWVTSEIDGAVTQEVAEELEFDLEQLTKVINFLLELEEHLDTTCKYCGKKDCDNDCDESQAGGF